MADTRQANMAQYTCGRCANTTNGRISNEYTLDGSPVVLAHFPPSARRHCSECGVPSSSLWMPAPSQPKPGERYLSRAWLDPNTKKPAAMKITKVSQGSIYYRPDYGLHEDGTEWLGSPARIDNTPEAIAKWLGARL